MKLTISIEFEVDDHDAGREKVNVVMPAVYGVVGPDEWSWEVTEEEDGDAG